MGRRLASLAAVVLVSGCLGSTPAPADPVAAEPFEWAAPGAPRILASGMLDRHHEFVRAHPDRSANSTDHRAAREALARELGALDDPLWRRPFRASSPFSEENLCTLHRGVMEPRSWVVVMGHYDSGGRAAGQGAYDNGGGARMVAELARAYAPLATYHSIAFCLIDGGDNGYSGSRTLLADVEDRRDIGSIRAAVFLDGFGLCWPLRTPIYLVQNHAGIRERVDEARRDLKVPDEFFRTTDRVIGSRLDAGPWFDAEVPVAFLISNIEETGIPAPAGGPVRIAYPFLHRGDTVETMTASAGGRADLERSFQTALDLAVGTVHRLTSDGRAL